MLALGSDDLTTKQLRKRLPDVAQASLYRAIARLVDAGIVAVVERRQRGGAMERVYRAVKAPDADHTTATTHGFVAAADTLARALSVDAAQWAASSAWRPHEAHLRREVLHLTEDEFVALKRHLEAHIDETAGGHGSDGATAMVVTFAAIPASCDPPHAEGSRP